MTVQTDVLKAGAGGQALTQKSESLWVDALRRLARNKAAVVGGIIILLLFLSAMFANFIAPYTYYEQVLVDNNKVPPWMLAIFPFMKPLRQVQHGLPAGRRLRRPRPLQPHRLWVARLADGGADRPAHQPGDRPAW